MATTTPMYISICCNFWYIHSTSNLRVTRQSQTTWSQSVVMWIDYLYNTFGLGFELMLKLSLKNHFNKKNRECSSQLFKWVHVMFKWYRSVMSFTEQNNIEGKPQWITVQYGRGTKHPLHTFIEQNNIEGKPQWITVQYGRGTKHPLHTFTEQNNIEGKPQWITV